MGQEGAGMKPRITITVETGGFAALRSVAIEALREFGAQARVVALRGIQAAQELLGVRHDHRHIMRKKIRRML